MRVDPRNFLRVFCALCFAYPVECRFLLHSSSYAGHVAWKRLNTLFRQGAERQFKPRIAGADGDSTGWDGVRPMFHVFSPCLGASVWVIALDWESVRRWPVSGGRDSLRVFNEERGLINGASLARSSRWIAGDPECRPRPSAKSFRSRCRNNGE